jgi:uncharacterized lipoprotein YmbA
MARLSRLRLCGLAAIVLLASVACSLKRPDTVQSRMIEPRIEAPTKSQVAALNVENVRLLDTQSRSHIGRRVLWQQADGELVEDPVWRWSSSPDRYLDTALRLELTSRADIQLVDAASAPALAVTLLAWQLESAGTPRLVGTIEVQFTAADRVVRAQVVSENEPVSMELPGDLAAAAGRLLRRLASEGVTRMTASPGPAP